MILKWTHEKSMCDYNSARLYEDTFNIPYNWKKWLPADMYRFHELVCKEVNALVELQMGILLPFISSVCGPFTKGHFLTRPSCLNLGSMLLLLELGNCKHEREWYHNLSSIFFKTLNMEYKILKFPNILEQIMYFMYLR